MTIPNHVRRIRPSVLLLVVISGCAVSGNRSQPGEPWSGNRQAGVVVPPGDTAYLRAAAPEDSVVLRRSGTKVLLSMNDVGRLAGKVRFDPQGQAARFFEQLQRTYESNGGWVELAGGMREDRLAADLIETGQAYIRIDGTGQVVPWVRIVKEREQTSPTTFRTGRAIYLPDGSLLIRVIDGITMS